MTVLDTAGFVDRKSPLIVQRSDWESGMLHSRRITPNIPEIYTLRWTAATPAQAADIIAWIDTYVNGTVFDYTPPGGSPAKFALMDDGYIYRRVGTLMEIDVAIQKQLAYD